jgi:hypothetical protein
MSIVSILYFIAWSGHSLLSIPHVSKESGLLAGIAMDWIYILAINW